MTTSNYTAAPRQPAQIEYRSYRLSAGGAPSGGEVALSVLKVLEGYNCIGSPAAVTVSTQRLNEALRFAYGMRSKLGDPYFVNGIREYQEKMLCEATAREIRAKISDDATHDVSWYDPDGLESLETPGTSHISVADADGMAVSLTTTVNLVFGNQVMVPETGVIMNNEMDDFSTPGASNAFGYIPSPANYIRPGKRPLSSTVPVIVEHENGRLYFVVGGTGGSRIITSTVQNLIHVLDGNMTSSEALAQPRLHDQLVPARTTFEYTYDNTTVTFLQDIGHNVSWVAPGQSASHVVRLLVNGTFEAAGDPRQTNSGGYAV